MTSNATEHPSEYLTFFVQGEEYAVALRRVSEVMRYDTITRVPQMPPAVRGVTNLRGQIVPVVDLMLKFHGAETPVDRRTCIVLVESVLGTTPTLLGLMTERVGQVLALAADQLSPPPTFGTPIRTEYLAAMAHVGKKFAMVLDIDRLLDAAELLSADLVAADPIELQSEPGVEAKD